jgi:hypothetical protein
MGASGSASCEDPVSGRLIALTTPALIAHVQTPLNASVLVLFGSRGSAEVERAVGEVETGGGESARGGLDAQAMPRDEDE